MNEPWPQFLQVQPLSRVCPFWNFFIFQLVWIGTGQALDFNVQSLSMFFGNQQRLDWVWTCYGTGTGQSLDKGRTQIGFCVQTLSGHPSGDSTHNMSDAMCISPYMFYMDNLFSQRWTKLNSTSNPYSRPPSSLDTDAYRRRRRLRLLSWSRRRRRSLQYRDKITTFHLVLLTTSVCDKKC